MYSNFLYVSENVGDTKRKINISLYSRSLLRVLKNVPKERLNLRPWKMFILKPYLTRLSMHKCSCFFVWVMITDVTLSNRTDTLRHTRWSRAASTSRSWGTRASRRTAAPCASITSLAACWSHACTGKIFSYLIH